MSHVIIHAIPFNTHIKRNGKHLVAHDQARAQKFLRGVHAHGPHAFKTIHSMDEIDMGHGEPDPAEAPHVPDAGDPEAAKHSIDVTDAAVTYTMSVGVGNPPTQYTLLIDTGSSNTWVGADKSYRSTPTSHNTGCRVNVTYGSGSFTGTEYTDQVTLSRNLVITNQSIGVATKASGFDGVDGILGIGPAGLTPGTVVGVNVVPTVTDNLYKQKIIPTQCVGISFDPTTQLGALNGELTFGATDTSKFKGEINYVPITKTSPASHYWGIDQTVTYGKTMRILDSCAGIVDTGTTLLLLATDAFQRYQETTGATMDSATGLLTVTREQYEKMESLKFRIGSVTYELTPDAQIWPRAMNSTLGGEDGKMYLITADLGKDSGSGLDFINGFAFLQRFYSVYDASNSRVGLATTKYTDAKTNMGKD